MKYSLILAFVLILSFAYGYKELKAADGHKALMELESGNHNIYVLFFHITASIGSDLAMTNDQFERALISQVLEKNDNFIYQKIDAKNQDFDELVAKTEIILTELEKSPSILIIENSKGVWIHGPDTVAKIGEYAEIYKKRSEAK